MLTKSPTRVLLFSPTRQGDAPEPFTRDLTFHWQVVRTPAQAEEVLRHAYFNLLLIDLRATDPTVFQASRQQVWRLLDHLDRADLEERYGFHRILVALDGPTSILEDETLIELGARGVTQAIRQRGDTEDGLRARITDRARALIRARADGKLALCASGGGITGIYFELGALKCLSDVLQGRNLLDFDMYFGISAGAVVTSMLAAGYRVDDFMAAIANVPNSRIRPISLNLLRLQHLNYRELGRRLLGAARSAGAMTKSLLLRRRDGMEEAIFRYSDLLGPPFHSEHFEHMIRAILARPGATNDFRQLKRELYIGASDQDRREHVLFGDKEWDHIPISRAVQASLSLNPAFSSVDVEGTYYEDGAVTRTSNFEEAIRRGANLVVVVDPFVPYVSKVPGAASRRGIFYNIDQNLRTISFTRFENARAWVLRRHPEVSAYTFLPSNRLRGLLSNNPMDHRPYLAIWRGAYLSTLRQIQRLQHRMTGDFRHHGFRIDTALAEEVASRLKATQSLTFADFYPAGRLPDRILARAAA